MNTEPASRALKEETDDGVVGFSHTFFHIRPIADNRPVFR